MTDLQSKAAAMATRLLRIEAAVVNDPNAIRMLENGWTRAHVTALPTTQKYMVFFRKPIGRGIAGSFVTTDTIL